MANDASKKAETTYIMAIPPDDARTFQGSQDNQRKSEIIKVAQQVLENKKKG